MPRRRKFCKVVIQTTNERGGREVSRCQNRIKSGTPFCREHFETHKLIEVKCDGEAHSNPFIDHCGVCMPYWGSYPVAVPKDAEGKPWERGL